MTVCYIQAFAKRVHTMLIKALIPDKSLCISQYTRVFNLVSGFTCPHCLDECVLHMLDGQRLDFPNVIRQDGSNSDSETSQGLYNAQNYFM